jgi:hypothetical protein
MHRYCMHRSYLLAMRGEGEAEQAVIAARRRAHPLQARPDEPRAPETAATS